MTDPSGVGAGVTLAERAAAHALDVLSQVADRDLASPTPCPGWDVGRLLLHVADAAALLTGLATTGERHFPDPPSSDVADPAEAARARVRHLLETLRCATPSGSGGRSEPPAAWVHEAACGAAIEVTAHTWDLAAALGSSVPVPDDLAADVHDLAMNLVTEDERRRHFGPSIDVAPTARSSDRLAGFLGRDPAWPVGTRS